MTHPMKPAQIEISKLIDHPANVRANTPESSDTDNITHLKASIAALGLIQPLLVQEIEGGFGVLAGKRRAAALAELATDKSAKGFGKKTKIDCRVIAKDCDVTTALSLAENITQEPMGPIDEYEAFQRMMEVDGQTPETIAMTFGTTVVAVKNRLRFGQIHPDIRGAARQKLITLDAMKAFAGHPNQDVQKDTFDALSQDGRTPSAYTVKDALKTRGIQIGDALGAFVRDTYEARGGAIARDLIDEHSVLEDMTLVNGILMEQLKDHAQVEATKLGFAWSDAMPKYDYATLAEYDTVYPVEIELDDDTQVQVNEIEAQIEALETAIEDEDISQDDYDAKYDEAEELQKTLRDLREGYSDEDLAVGGVMAYWSQGEVGFVRGLVKQADEDTASTPDGTSEDDAISSDSGPGATRSGTDADEITYSAALSADLQTERAMALGAALTQNPTVAMDLAMFQIVGGVFCYRKPTYAVDIDISKQYRTHAKLDEIDATSLEQVAHAHDELDLSWNNDDASPAKQFADFRALSLEEKAKLVAYAVGSATTNNFARHPSADALMHDLEIEVMPDVRAHWTPNASFFGRLKKAWLLNILSTDLDMANEAVQLANAPKKDIVAFLDTLFAEPFATLKEEQLVAIETWCPPHMQTTPANEASDQDLEGTTSDTDDVETKMAA